MDKINRIKDFLNEHDIKFFENEEGLISVNVGMIPKELFKKYHDFCYKLDKEYEKLKK